MKNRDVLKLLKNLPENTKSYIDNIVPKTYAGSDTAGGVATEAAKVSNALNLALGATQGGQRVTFDGSSAQTLVITPSTINAAYASHTHEYAASNTEGGVATEAAKTTGTLTIQTNGTEAVTFNGSANKSLDITPDSIGAAESGHTHSNYALANHTHNYAGSSTAGGVATEAAKTTGTLTIKTNGTSAITFNGSSNKSLDITPDDIGAAASSHTHSNYSLTTHTHNYAGSTSAGGTATEAAKTTGTLTIQTNGTSTATFNGSANKSINITPDAIGAATSVHTHSGYASITHTHLYAGSSTAGGVATEAAKTTGTLTIQTNGTSAATFNGSSNKTINITPSSIGAATSGHTHSEYALANHTHSGYASSSHSHGLLNSNMTKEINGSSGGWSMISESYNGFLLVSLRGGATVPAWFDSAYSSGIAFGGSDTKGVLSVSYSSPSVTFAGGAGSAPSWNMNLTGSSGTTYNLNNFASKTDLGNIDDILDSINGISL